MEEISSIINDEINRLLDLYNDLKMDHSIYGFCILSMDNNGYLSRKDPKDKSGAVNSDKYKYLQYE